MCDETGTLRVVDAALVLCLYCAGVVTGLIVAWVW